MQYFCIPHTCNCKIDCVIVAHWVGQLYLVGALIRPVCRLYGEVVLSDNGVFGRIRAGGHVSVCHGAYWSSIW